MNLVSGFLSNESAFGKLMTRIGTIIAVNIMFAICTIPLITIGAGFTAMHYTLMRCLRGNWSVNPFKEFYRGFTSNFLKATGIWICELAAGGMLLLEYYWCGSFGGFFLIIRYGIMALLALLAIMVVYLFPVTAAFNGGIRELMKNAVYFAFTKPLYLVTIMFFNVFPLVLTYSDRASFPIYGFIWSTIGFGLVGLLTSYLLLQQFKPYLPAVDSCGDIIEEPEEEAHRGSGKVMSEKEILEEMKRLDI